MDEWVKKVGRDRACFLAKFNSFNSEGVRLCFLCNVWMAIKKIVLAYDW